LKFAVVGGDERSAALCAMLCRDGHRVSSFALEKAALPEEILRAGCLESCVYAADCVVLPLPAEKAGLLNAPLSEESIRMETVLSVLWPGQIVCGGRFAPESCKQAIRGKLHLEDIMMLPEFSVGNAAITAEGALELMMSANGKALWGSRILITGWGRIGSILSLRLLGLGAGVSVAARNAEDRAMAAALGCKALDYPQLEGEIAEFDFVVNTVPARVISDAMLCCCSPDTVLLELASPPGGFDRALAENIGLKVIYGPGLPGKCAPYAAALLMRSAIYALIKNIGGAA